MIRCRYCKRPAQAPKRGQRKGIHDGMCQRCRIRHSCHCCGRPGSSILCRDCGRLTGGGGQPRKILGPDRERRVPVYTERAARGLPLFEGEV